MRAALACFVLVLMASLPAVTQRRDYDFTGKWKLENPGGGTTVNMRLELVMDDDKVSGKLIAPYGEFPVENGWAGGEDIFFNVTVKRDEYVLKTTYRGHRFAEEVQYTVEAGERVLQLIARRDE